MSDSDFVVTPAWALVMAIHEAGPKGMSIALRRGLRAEHLGDAEDPAVKVYELFEKFHPKGALPSVPEIKLRSGIPFEEGAGFDLETAIDHMAHAIMFKELREGIGKSLKTLKKNPVEGREELSALVRKSARWERPNDPRGTNSAEWRGDMFARFLKAASRLPGELLGLPYPWESLNEKSLGLIKGELSALLAKRKTGKTWMTLAICDHIIKNAAKKGDKILYISPEMTEPLVMSRNTAVHLKLDYAKFRGGKLEASARKRLEDYANHHEPGAPEILWFYGTDLPNRSVEDITVLAEQHEPILIMIDSFYCLGDRRKKMYDRTLESIERMTDLKTYAPVFLTSQFSADTKKKDTNSEADSAAYARALGDYVDALYGLFPPKQGRESRILRCMEAREFDPIDIRIGFDMTRMDFSEIEVIDEEADAYDGADPAQAAGFVQDDAIEY